MAPIAQIIKYEGDNSTFIWKHPSEDFNSLTQLIVHESQEAIFFMNGQILDSFGPGRHTLETQNIPKIGKFFNRTTGGETPFHCEVYFVNKTVQMAVKWGTDTRVRFIEPTFGIPVEIGASGEMNIMVLDPRKLLVKIVGTMKGVSWDSRSMGFTKSLLDSFRPLISTAVKTNLSSCIKSQNINILEVDENLGILSEALRVSMLPGFEEYGLTIPEFYVTGVVLPENDANFKKIRDLHTISLQKKMIEAETVIKTAKAESAATVTAAERQIVLEQETTETEVARREAERELIRAQAEAQKVVIDSQAQATKRAQEGYTYQQERGFDVASEVAKNEAVGEFTNMGVGFGTMAGVGGAVGGMVGGMMNDAMNVVTAPAAAPTTSATPSNDMAAFKAKVDKLTMMKEAGMLSEEEFNSMKAQLLSEIL